MHVTERVVRSDNWSSIRIRRSVSCMGSIVVTMVRSVTICAMHWTTIVVIWIRLSHIVSFFVADGDGNVMG